MPLLASIIVLTNLAFSAAWDTDAHSPAWVEYTLDPSDVVHKSRATNSFSPDPRAPGSDLAADYRRSGYDRGHLAPAADMAFDPVAYLESFRYTNVVPQVPATNRGRWLDIEREIRALAASNSVRVVVAPLYDDRITNRIGRVRVPSHLVKAVWGSFGFRIYCVPNFTVSQKR